jgi:ribosomal protein S18 acetylase RimI-like enzyme
MTHEDRGDAAQPTLYTLRVPVTIRVAQRDDLPKLEWYGTYAYSRNFIRNAYVEQTHQRRLMLVADLNGFPVGQVYLQFIANNPVVADGHTRAYLYAFRVIDHLRGCGIGTLLMHHAEAAVRQRGFQVLMLQVAKENPAAQRLYHRLGYAIIGEDPGDWSYVDHHGVVQHVHEPVWVMQKPLA